MSKNGKYYRLGIGFFTDTLTSADIQEYVTIGGTVTEKYEGLLYKKIFFISQISSRVVISLGKWIDKSSLSLFC